VNCFTNLFHGEEGFYVSYWDSIIFTTLQVRAVRRVFPMVQVKVNMIVTATSMDEGSNEIRCHIARQILLTARYKIHQTRVEKHEFCGMDVLSAIRNRNSRKRFCQPRQNKKALASVSASVPETKHWKAIAADWFVG